SLDGVPKDIELETVKEEALKINGVRSIYHVHVWAMSTTENAMTAHLVLNREASMEKEIQIKHEFRHAMEHLNIRHITVETEKELLLTNTPS
ncbi:MAG: cation transporter, partial [Chitinophagaceae bacterium]|nr:cation transporter [Chitinophagaceae bacterium]